jgi:uncharacterized protein (DUF2236 family)
MSTSSLSAAPDHDPGSTPQRRAPGIQGARVTMESLDRSTPDPGLFGPESLSWRVHHDPAAVLGGIRALFLQSLHPEVMLGFYGVTGTRDDPWGRLARTGSYVNAITYGTEAEAETAAARVRKVHAALRLDRPDWLLWVHAGAVDSWLAGHRRSGAPMTDAEADAFVEEQVIAARLIGCVVDDVPRTVAQLDDYMTAVRPRLEVTPEAREAARGLLWPPMATRIAWLTPARPAWTTLTVTGFALLPRWSRRMFALPGLPTTDLSASISARALRSVLIGVPDAKRTNPHLAAARIRLGLAEDRASA